MRGPNMSYCMWENTSRALDQCIQGLEEAENEDGIEEYIEGLSKEEQRGLRKILAQAEIIREFQESYSIDL